MGLLKLNLPIGFEPLQRNKMEYFLFDGDDFCFSVTGREERNWDGNLLSVEFFISEIKQGIDLKDLNKDKIYLLEKVMVTYKQERYKISEDNVKINEFKSVSICTCCDDPIMKITFEIMKK